MSETMIHAVFKLTFNNTAVREFQLDSYSGLQIRLDENRLYIKPVYKVNEIDTFEMIERTRGGVEILIENRQELYDFFTRRQVDGISFLLTKGETWIGARQAETEEGSKYLPRMRVWIKKDDQGESGIDVRDFVSKVVAMSQMVADYSATGRVGRPPKRIAAAKATIRRLSEAMSEQQTI
jgi:hypothetical protein